LEIGLLKTVLFGNKDMADTISRTFVIVVLLDYVVILGILVRWMVRTWLPERGKTSDPRHPHGIAAS
jgi:hypothetical protein